MTKRTHVYGVDEAVQTLNRHLQEMQGVTLKGLIRAGTQIRRTAQKLCPVVTGNLKASAYIVTSRGSAPAGKTPTFKGDDAAQMSSNHSSTVQERRHAIRNEDNPTVEVGFTAVYAARVHENPNTGQATYPGASEVGQWKFLEEALKQNEIYVVDVIRREAKT